MFEAIYEHFRLEDIPIKSGNETVGLTRALLNLYDYANIVNIPPGKVLKDLLSQNYHIFSIGHDFYLDPEELAHFLSTVEES